VYYMFVPTIAFFAKVSDPVIGGTYMTLLNTVCNLGVYFVLVMVVVTCCGSMPSPVRNTVIVQCFNAIGWLIGRAGTRGPVLSDVYDKRFASLDCFSIISYTSNVE